MDPWLLQGSYQLAMGHSILLMPIDLFEKRTLGALWQPVLAVCPDNLLDRTAKRAVDLGFALPAASFSSLSDDSIDGHWRAIHKQFSFGKPLLEGLPTLARRLDLAALDLPHRLLMRRLGRPSEQPEPNVQPLALVRRSIYDRAFVAAAAELDRRGESFESPDLDFAQAVTETVGHRQITTSLALPGVPPAYVRRAYSPELKARVRPTSDRDVNDVWAPEIGERPDAMVERAAIEFVLTHRATANGGPGLMMPSVPAQAFTLLAQLEKHFRDATQDHPSSVRKLLNRLNAVVRPLFTEAVIEAVRSASALSVFSNFPLGLVTMPGDTAPLAARLPIAYEPMLPLTRTVQRAATSPVLDWDNRISILVAECIPTSDPVGAESRRGWQLVQQMHADTEGLTLHLAETLSLEALHKAVKEHAPDILIISAHGKIAGTAAALVIGDQSYVGLGLEKPPPVILLSACHVAPRGAGAVSIADLLLREGAMAVLGTQVPVDVRRNLMLMSRLLANLAHHLANPSQNVTLLEVWHHVQTSNVINDVLMATPALMEWGRTPGPNGLTPQQEFMRLRSSGRLRPNHIYEDTEQVLGEIADDQGVGAQIRNWFRRPGYVPESLFYLFAGRPERIHLSSVRNRVKRFQPDM
ncbi:CHAT domain-containing protein [Kitasatospora misakiensis]